MSHLNYDTFINLLFGRVPRADVTWGLVLINGLVFALLALSGHGVMQIPSELLIRFGGNLAPLVQKGEVWRLGTALFLHGGLLHVGLNMLALYQAGQVVERLFGRAGFILIYGLAGLLGNVASLWWKQGPVSVGASGAIFGVYGALLAYLSVQRGSVPGEVFKEMRSGTLGFIGYSLFAGFALPGIDNAAHLGGLLAGLVLGACMAMPLAAPRPVRWLSPRLWGGVAIVTALGGAMWTQAPELVRRYEMGAAFNETLQRFSIEEQELLREQASLMEALQRRRATETAVRDALERECLVRWERQITQLSWREAPAGQEWYREELIEYATARRDAVKALVQALETRQSVWLERARNLQVQADNILLQIRLRKSMEDSGR
ncbi:rhomboid family intramembrane serine protease [Zoogloea sp.]|uniref:rhomboid family intramembrane serine protease n=1 Tax=Zoogloea sp. TaxID=49181 RepID=UPI0014159191|nr:MAG: rhomboid family intramembrane serine protease [Zoogloea sp.]